eukprot:Pompholyxophrys_punicea_v1_NODE_1046_length_1014_cov_4.479666.p3 type:complete len:110 gc:universal NODE_1046_length_1014_cov_4.479666:360-689(+)
MDECTLCILYHSLVESEIEMTKNKKKKNKKPFELEDYFLNKFHIELEIPEDHEFWKKDSLTYTLLPALFCEVRLHPFCGLHCGLPRKNCTGKAKGKQKSPTKRLGIICF